MAFCTKYLDTMYTCVEERLKALNDSGEFSEFLNYLEGSLPSSQPSSISLVQALSNSWTTLCRCLSRHKETGQERVAQAHPAGTLTDKVEPALEDEKEEEATWDGSSEFWAQTALDYSWEQLHSGSWEDVSMFWREAYALAAVLHGFNLALQEKNQDALVIIDRGILMGAPVLNNLLHSFARDLQKKLQLIEGGKNEHITRKIGKVKFRNYSPETISDKKIKLSSEQLVDMKNVPLIDMNKRIPTIHYPSLEAFYSDYMTRSVPVVLTGVMDHWPSYAQQKWSLSYLKDVAGPRTVPVELGSRYTDQDWSQKLMTVSEFIDDHILSASQQRTSPKAYLAQHQLFDQVPELREDICVPEYCYMKTPVQAALHEADQQKEEQTSQERDLDDGSDSAIRINCWFGPEGTVSPLHFDPDHNLLAQVVGRKYVRLYEEDQTQYLYPHSGLLSNTSQVDVEAPNMSSFPLFSNAQYSEFTLHAGQMLYIPPRCWHYLRSLDTSFSVSFWWS